MAPRNTTKKAAPAVVCRLCLVKVVAGIPIFATKNVSETSSLQMKIMELANVQVYAGDGLPCRVCFNCSKLVDSYHAFKIQIEKSDAILRHQLSTSQTDPLSVEKSDVATLTPDIHEELVKAETLFIKDEADTDECDLDEEEKIIEPSIELTTDLPSNSPAPESSVVPPDVEDDGNGDDVDMDPLAGDGVEPDSSSNAALGNSAEPSETPAEPAAGIDSHQSTSNILFQSLTKPTARAAKRPRKAASTETTAAATITSAESSVSTAVPTATVTSGSLIESKEEVYDDDEDEDCMDDIDDDIDYDDDDEDDDDNDESLAMNEPRPSTSKTGINDTSGDATNHDEAQVNAVVSGDLLLATDLDLGELLTKSKALRKNRNKDCAVCGFVGETYSVYLKHIEEHLVLACTICNKTFSKMVNLRRHKQEVHSDLGYTPCELCGNLFKSVENLRHHMKRIHLTTDGDQVACDQCGKVFKTKINLNCHMKAVHEVTECFCPVCNKPCKNLLHLRAHMYSHTTESRVCEICGKYVRYLRSHMNVVHATHVKCPTCGNMFRSNKYLQKHIKFVHSNIKRDFVCDTCGAAFSTKIVLTNHFLTHSNERKHKCHICEKSFKTKHVLKTHQRVHNNNDPYTCWKCGETFKWKGSHTKHLTKCSVGDVPV